jgi:holliday junction DNA helicase RuvA
MINHLHGLLVEKQPPLLVIDVQGVGYEVLAPLSTFERLPELNQTVKLLTHLSMRDDTQVLYGFSNDAERLLFRTLIRVNGVGPKLALSILSTMDLTSFVQCVHDHNIQRLTRIPGVGKKTAERLVIEMRDRLANWSTNQSLTTTSPRTLGIISPVDDAISALIALGYKPQEASRWVHAVAEEGLTSEALIRRALQSAV